ncbi:MAG: dihydroorotate dehydrogenase [Mycoplasma sp.]
MNKKLSSNVFGIEFKNPIMPASGTFNSGKEVDKIYDISELGAVMTKSVTIDPRKGNAHPRVCDTELGMLNAIGLANPGVDFFINKDLPFLRTINTNIIINVTGKKISEFSEVIKKLEKYDFIDAYEINASCPNVETGISYMANEEIFSELIKLCRNATLKPIIVKISPEGFNVVELAKIAEKHGANGITLINTIKGMRIDLANRKPFLANKFGGYSGPGIKPIALRYVYEVYENVKIPIIGVGGIQNEYDVLEYLMAGASLVQIGTCNFIDPLCMKKIISNLEKVLVKYNFKSISEAIGAAHDKK